MADKNTPSSSSSSASRKSDCPPHPLKRQAGPSRRGSDERQAHKARLASPEENKSNEKEIKDCIMVGYSTVVAPMSAPAPDRMAIDSSPADSDYHLTEQEDVELFGPLPDSEGLFVTPISSPVPQCDGDDSDGDGDDLDDGNDTVPLSDAETLKPSATAPALAPRRPKSNTAKVIGFVPTKNNKYLDSRMSHQSSKSPSIVKDIRLTADTERRRQMSRAASSNLPPSVNVFTPPASAKGHGRSSATTGSASSTGSSRGSSSARKGKDRTLRDILCPPDSNPFMPAAKFPAPLPIVSKAPSPSSRATPGGASSGSASSGHNSSSTSSSSSSRDRSE